MLASMSVDSRRVKMQKIALKLMGYARYRALDALQVWRGVTMNSDAPHWCLILFDQHDRNSISILQSLFNGLKTTIEPASLSDVQTVIDSRQAVIWCFSDYDVNGHVGKDQAVHRAADQVFDVLSVGHVNTPLVLLPTLDQIKCSAEIKQKLWQYFLHLK